MTASPLPTGPYSPAPWQLIRYTLWPLEVLRDCRRRYGDPFTLRMSGFGKFVFLADPEAVKDVFRGDPHVLHSGEGNEFLSLSVGKNSVLVLDDELHAQQRRVLLPPMKGERLRSFHGAMQQATLDVMRTWRLNQPFAAEPFLRQIITRVIVQAVLGVGPGEELTAYEQKIARLLSYMRSRYSLIGFALLPQWLAMRPGWLPFGKELRELDQMVYGFMRKMRELPAADRGDNIVAELLSAHHEDGTPLSDTEIRDAVFTMLLAGVDTTSAATAWQLELMVPREDVMGEVHHELKHYEQTLPTPEQLEELAYLDAALREGLRLRSILPFVVRKTKQPFAAAGREYPPGVLLCPCSYLVHRRPELYPEPEKFRPERFLERKFTPYEWFPFGGGNRMCLGMIFAMYQMKVMLSTIFSRARLERPKGATSYPIRRGLVLSPHDGARIILRERIGANQSQI